MNSSLIMASVDSKGGKLQKSITDINPNIDTESAVEFVKALNGLTKNTYQSTTKVDRYEIKDVEKLPELEGFSLVTDTDNEKVNLKANSFSIASISKASDGDYYHAIAMIQTPEDADVVFQPTELPELSFGYVAKDSDDNYLAHLIIPTNDAKALGKFEFTLTSYADVQLHDYKPVTLTFTATA